MVVTRLSLARRRSLQNSSTSSSSPKLKRCYKKKRISMKVCGLSTPRKTLAVASPHVPPVGSNGDTPLQKLSPRIHIAPKIVPSLPVPPLGSNGDHTPLQKVSTSSIGLNHRCPCANSL
uniref:Uncharacterized protein n=1 Tax=Nicotiana tabacum TaxID=4097 RepID=A0A1S4A1K8_TOBAC|nr:PREDICTED: uncharacterized protein LOC107792764 [Nicotiana tabacum]